MPLASEPGRAVQTLGPPLIKPSAAATNPRTPRVFPCSTAFTSRGEKEKEKEDPELAKEGEEEPDRRRRSSFSNGTTSPSRRPDNEINVVARPALLQLVTAPPHLCATHSHPDPTGRCCCPLLTHDLVLPSCFGCR